ncbi:unnamed protein product [Mytilus coruscus]|uniref:Uncharacterized protein n=1 Tax=Mytilus coruscus TaxID=42192 RepID=A0A6J8B6C1_MYTCO|nr:unnamed protein product [Mytilus coruscus]
MKLQEDKVLFSIFIDSDLNCRIIVLGKVVKFENILEDSTSIKDASIVEKLMKKITCMKICPGNNDFSDICRNRYPNTLEEFRNTEDILLASEENLAHGTTIRTVACGMLCDSQQERCSNCQVFRPNLFMQRGRMKNNSSETKLTHRLDYMTTGQLKERVLNSRDEIRSLKRKMESLKKGLSRYCDKLGVKLDVGISESFVSIMKTNTDIALSKFKENSPQYILWKQQLEAATKSNLKQMRWIQLC